ncbi:translation initiation factor IF-2 [Mitsuokella multacida]|uniref:Translation initiation factor IF-2 n=1 Tax=Mitsuokella multacida DSM 20544 TaxID=500635 RepID=C9KKC4_9FIRM|nr:translation initiation factor IF-2 [Mitsuokella multacida]EEX69574.1 translation initiation factor IF-2 [Mitsuokella multacida DSM 20544]
MSKYRVYELAKEFNTDSKVILDILKRNKFKAANNFSSVGEEERTAIKNSLSNKGAKPQAKAPAASAAQKPAAKPAEKRAEKPQAGKQNHGNSGSNGNNGRTERNERNERRSDAGRNNGNGNHNGGNRAASGSNRPSHNSGGNSGNNGGNRNSNGGGNNNRGGNRNDRRNGSRNERGGRNDRNDRNNRFGSKNDRNRRGRNNKRGGQQAPKVEIAHPKHIKLPETIAVKDLASKMSYTAAEVVKKLFMMGVMATINQEIDFDTAALVASEFGVTCEELPPEVDPTEIPEIEDDPKTLKLRPPVVTVMGHVDHGKTSLLDCIRNTHVQTHEAGGITQHIGAYQVNCKGKKIVFLDTPGHEAFTAMRARGAQITDIAILVVAADDGVMPQTIEAIHHAKSAGVPIIVAINKIDKPGANPDRVKQELMEQGLVPEEYGGDTIMVPVSAKKQIGIDDLLEMVLLVAEVKELKANPNRDARGVIVEAKLDKGRGPVATVLVQNGTLRIGDSVVCGTTYGKVRAMVNDRGENVKKAGPSVPVEILGLNDVPEAGDILAVLEEKQARSIAEARIERQRNNLIKSKKVSLDDLFHQIQEGDIKDLNIVIKADVQGSVEALSSSLLKLNKNDEVRVSIVHSGVGAVNESDVMLASASNALIIAFNVRPDANARKLADTENIDIRTYRVIYDAINDVKDAMSGMLKPKYKEVIQGRVEIRQVMKFSKALVAGSYVLEGKICNNSKIRIIRDNIEIFDGEIDSLRRFKDEVKEVNAGYECGISIVDFRDFKEGDIIEAYTMEEIATTIADANKAAAKKREEEAKAAAAKAKENAKD